MDLPPPVYGEHLVFVTEDRPYWGRDGCDAITVFSNQRGMPPLHRGATRPSPGRLAAVSDLSLVLAARSNGIVISRDQDRYDPSSFFELYVVRRVGPSPDAWRDTYLDSPVPVADAGGIAVGPDDETLIVATKSLEEGCGGHQVYGVAKFHLSEIDWTANQLGPVHGRYDFDLPIAEVIFTSGGSIAHLVALPSSEASPPVEPQVISLDVDTMTEIAPSVPIEPVRQRPLEDCSLGYSHATISPDERYLVINRWDREGLSAVDLVTRESWTIETPGVARTGGVAFSRRGHNRGLLAVHAIDKVVIYQWHDERTIRLRSQVEVEPPISSPDGHRRFGAVSAAAVEWSGSGSHVIAAVATTGPVEFRSWRVEDGGRRLVAGHEFEACPQEPNMPNDILTGNGILPTQTPTATVTPSATSTATSTSTATATVTPTATATRVPKPLYLPIVLREECVPEKQRVDVALVIDASTSMEQPTTAGRSKLEAAREAALRFIDQLHLDQGDQAAIVAFNHDAEVVQPLTTDRSALETALTGIAPERQTCLVCAVNHAAEELSSERRVDDNIPLLILLTDGKSNPRPAGEAVERARVAKANGVVIFTIGLGSTLDTEALRQIASQPGYFKTAPDAEELAGIYTEIAGEIPCPAEQFWGGQS